MKDLRLALRLLGKSPGFTLVALLLLALGIGGNTAFFSVFKAQVLTPFPYPEPQRVVQLWRTNGEARASAPWSLLDYGDVRDQATTLAESGVYRPETFTLGGAAPTTLEGIACTAGVLRALGVRPALGRWFNAEDERMGTPSVVILSHACWLQQFGGDPAAIGREVRLDGQGYTVVGVMPASFEFYCPWTGKKPAALWMCLRVARQGQFRGAHWLLAVGRLKDGASAEAATAELRIIGDRLAAMYPSTNYGKWFYAIPLSAEVARAAWSRYTLIVAAVALVLVVASANLAIMLLARGSGRQVEYAVRLALGASRGDLVRLALTESAVLAVLGGAAGVFVAWNGTNLLSTLFVPFSAHGSPIVIDRVVLGYSLALALIAALAAGLPPALTAARTDVVTSIKEGGITQAGSHARHRFLRQLVAAQVAVALLLANTALLLLVNHRAALAVSEPLSSEFVLAAPISLKGTTYLARQAKIMFWDRYLERVRALPGVTSAGVATHLPLAGASTTTVLANDEAFEPKMHRRPIAIGYASPDYFAAMGIGRHAGRTFELSDVNAKTPGVVVNRTLAEMYWPGHDAVGQTLRNDGPKLEYTATVVGVVDDVRQWDIGYPASPAMYLPVRMDPSDTMYLVVRSAYDARRITPLLRRELAEMDRDLALGAAATMAELVNDAARARRTLLHLTEFFMFATLVMTAIGVYGTLSFQTRQRTREIGVRLALGAAARDVVALVLRQTVPSLASGVAVGVALSFGAAYALRTFFADVSVINPLYYLGGATLLAFTVALACWAPARRATRVNPVEALRVE